MNCRRFRHSIAVEAARLILQHAAVDLYTARKQAARKLTRRRLASADLPSESEIQDQIFEQSGLYRHELEISRRVGIRVAALRLLEALKAFPARVTGDVLEDDISTGAQISLLVLAESLDPVMESLASFGPLRGTLHHETRGTIHFVGTIGGFEQFPFEVQVYAPEVPPWPEDHSDPYSCDREGLSTLLQEGTPTNFDELTSESDPEAYHPDAFDVFRMYLGQLEQVRLNPQAHPEGDLLYHSLQVFELGRAEQPYDEEFLLACLLHDVGYALDRRHPAAGLCLGIAQLVTPRTWYLLEHQAIGHEYLETGRMSRSVANSEHREDLILLARCDREGRLCGRPVPTVDEALEYLQALPRIWDQD